MWTERWTRRRNPRRCGPPLSPAAPRESRRSAADSAEWRRAERKMPKSTIREQHKIERITLTGRWKTTRDWWMCRQSIRHPVRRVCREEYHELKYETEYGTWNNSEFNYDNLKMFRIDDIGYNYWKIAIFFKKTYNNIYKLNKCITSRIQGKQRPWTVRWSGPIDMATSDYLDRLYKKVTNQITEPVISRPSVIVQTPR